MARSLLGIKTATLNATPLQPGIRSGSATRLDDAALQARLRQKRSSAYMQALARLDAGGHVHNQAATQALIDAIRQELPDVQIDALALGIVSRCHLGAPYQVHTLDCSGRIIQHYKTFESLPSLLERARNIALHPGYAFIEVYSTRLIAVSDSGQTAFIDV